MFRYLYPLITIFIFTQSCSKHEDLQFRSNDSFSKLTIESQKEKLSFKLKINEHNFPISTNELLDYIKQSAITQSVPDYIAAWQFVSNETLHGNSISNSFSSENLPSFINSHGLGLCGLRANALFQIWQLQGYESRLSYLNGHVVPELIIDNKWQLYDPDHEVFYLDSNKQVQSVEQLINSPSLIDKPVSLNSKMFEEDELSDYLKYNKNTALVFAKSDKVEYKKPLIKEDYSYQFSLPPNAKFTFPELGAYSEDLVYKKAAFIKIQLYPSMNTQQLIIPFNFYKAIGNCSIKKTELDSTSIILIDNIEDSVELLFLVNSRFWLSEKIDSVHISGLNLSKAKIRLSASSEESSNPFLETNYFFNKVKKLPGSFEEESFFLKEFYVESLKELHSKHKISIDKKLKILDLQMEEMDLILKEVDKTNYPKEFMFYLLMVLYNDELVKFKELVNQSNQKIQNLEKAT